MPQEPQHNAAQRRVEQALVAAQHPGAYGAWTLFVREFKRFWNIAAQTIVSPVITTMLYFLVFGYSLGDRLKDVRGVPYIDFLVPGLVMLAIINNAFINAAFSLFIANLHGSLVDILVTPLSHLQLMIAYTAASMTRALIVGAIIWLVAALMGASTLAALGWTIAFMLLTALTFSLLGLVVAILAEEFDHVNLLPNFLITPLTFLGGVFYSIEMLPAPWSSLSRFNPVLYMVNGLRYGMTGYSDVSPWQGLIILSALSAVLGAVLIRLLSTGYKLRA